LLTYTGLFWVPSLLFVLFLFPRVAPAYRRPFWLAALIMGAVSIVMEQLFLHFEVWGFSEAVDPLVGWWVLGAPVEEYVYWFGATPFCLSVYLGYRRLLGRKDA